MDSSQVFNDSYARLLISFDKFFIKFYQNFIKTSDDIEKLFRGVSQEKRQKMMESSFIMLTNMGSVSHSLTNPEFLEIIEKHKRMPGINPAMCDLWVESLLQTVKEYDPYYNATVEKAWRLYVAPGVEQIRLALAQNNNLDDNRLLQWCESYSVGHEDLDSQHRKLLDIVNSLTRMVSDTSSSSILFILDSLSQYTVYHFTYEEQYFEENQFPGIEQHKEKHREFLNQVLLWRELFESNTPPNLAEISKYLRSWLINHISIADKKMVKWIDQNSCR